jgi:lysophospholipase L1-like esterase
VPWTIADTANAGIWISNVDGQAKTITVEYTQLEDKTLRPNENASEFASATSWFNTTDSQPIVFWGDSMTARGYPEKTGAVLTNVNAINKGVGGETSTQIKNRFLAAPRYNSALTIIWVGHNNAAGVGKQEEVEGDIQAIIAGLTGGANYLVLTLASGSSTDAGDGYTNITAINNWIVSTYPNNHFPAKTFLQSHYDPNNAQDVIDIAQDRVPSSLRADATHLTPAADQMLAEAVASSLTAKGWASLGYNTITPGKGILIEPASGASGATQPVVITGTPVKPYLAGKQWIGQGKVTFNSLIAGDNYIWSSYVDANNYTALIVNGTSAIFRRRVGGSNKDATATITAPALGIQYDWKFRILASGAAEVTFGTVTASSSDTTAPQLAANSAFQLGCLNNANQISGLIQEVKVQ